MEKVSVIIPVYNVQNYVRCCIDSVRRQTYTNLEILLLDDGSTDQSGEICEQYARMDKRVSVFHKKNEGVSAARKFGIEHATGEYVCFVDSDDYVHPSLVEFMIEKERNYHAGIIQIAYRDVTEDEFGECKTVSDAKEYVFDTFETLYHLERAYSDADDRLALSTSVIWGKLYRRELFHDITFQKEMYVHEDQMVIHRLIIAGKGMVYVDAPLYYYRKRRGSLMQSGWNASRLSIVDCYKDRLLCVCGITEGDEVQRRKMRELILHRYFICIFRNYVQVQKYMKGTDAKRAKKMLIQYFKQERQCDRGISLSKKDKLLFTIFGWFPGGCAWMYRLARVGKCE